MELVHLTGISAALTGLAQVARRLLDDSRRTRVVFDVNYRAALWSPQVPGPTFLDLARRSDVVLVGLDEAGAVWGVSHREDIRALLPGVAELVVKGRAAASARVV